MPEYCPICEARIRFGSFESGNHRCSERRLRSLEARRRRDADEEPDEPDAYEKLADWSEMISSYEEDREDDR